MLYRNDYLDYREADKEAGFRKELSPDDFAVLDNMREKLRAPWALLSLLLSRYNQAF